MSRRILQWAAVPVLLCFCALAQAVHMSDTGRGGALIVPYWTPAGGNDTLLTVRNHDDGATAAKFRLMDADGGEIGAWNIYLDAGATYTLSISNTFGQVLMLSGLDTACIAPLATAFNGAPSMRSPGFENGYIEIVEMGRAADETGLAAADAWPACEEVNERLFYGDWRDDPNAGILPPGGALSASVSLINVEVGGMVAIDATALAGFSDIAQHTLPESDVPSLATPHDSGAEPGKTRSRICTATDCRTDAWDLPVEAVAAVLMAKEIEADVVINPAIGAQAELVMVKPLERYWSVFSESKLYLRRRDGTTVVGTESPPGVCVGVGTCTPERSAPWFPVDSLSAVAVVSLNTSPEDVGLEQVSPILSATIFPSFSLEDREFVSGIASVFFEQRRPPFGTTPSICNDEICMFGEPVIGFVIQQFTNGTLIDADGIRIRANYRTAVEWSRKLDIRDVQ